MTYTLGMTTLLTVAETTFYTRKSEELLLEAERMSIVDFLSCNPKAGKVIRGTGGIRKLRWAREGMGKSGGVRIIYYFHSEQMPLWLLSLFAKNKREDLSPDQRKILCRLVESLLKESTP